MDIRTPLSAAEYVEGGFRNPLGRMALLGVLTLLSNAGCGSTSNNSFDGGTPDAAGPDTTQPGDSSFAGSDASHVSSSTDSGGTDAGSSGGDTSPGGSDTGTSTSDTGTAASDTGTAATDAATTADSGPFPFHPAFILGADISWTLQDENAGGTYADDTGVKPIEDIMAENGFNFIRLRTFVQPSNSGGYAPGSANIVGAPGYGTADGGWCSTAATVKMAQRVKKCGMGVFVDFHMSDTWESLGVWQDIPASWVGLSQTPPSTPVSAATAPANGVETNIFQAAHDYVAGVMKAMVAGGVKPDMVQIGNESNGGMSDIAITDQPAFADLVNAGITAVRETDPRIIVWAQNGRPRPNSAGGDNFDGWVDTYLSGKAPNPLIDEDGICGSTYGTTDNGADWTTCFDYVLNTYNKPVMSCEYTDESPDSPAGALINGIMHGFPNHMGYGSFIWEPTRYPNLNSNTLFTCGAGVSGSCSTPWKFTTNAAMTAYPTLAKSYGLPVPSGTCQ
jgi:arabinogalactan endo-1,4-beta-galactosidase